MTIETVPLTAEQEDQLRAADQEVQAAYRQVDVWLRERAANGTPESVRMTDEQRAAYTAARAKLSEATRQREALRARLFQERTMELRRQHLAGMIADQQIGHDQARSAAQSAARHRSLIDRLLRRP